MNLFLSELSKLELVSDNHDVDQMFSHFYKEYNSLITKFAPMRPPTKHKFRNITKPWITHGLRTSIKKKNQLL